MKRAGTGKGNTKGISSTIQLPSDETSRHDHGGAITENITTTAAARAGAATTDSDIINH